MIAEWPAWTHRTLCRNTRPVTCGSTLHTQAAKSTGSICMIFTIEYQNIYIYIYKYSGKIQRQYRIVMLVKTKEHKNKLC